MFPILYLILVTNFGFFRNTAVVVHSSAVHQYNYNMDFLLPNNQLGLRCATCTRFDPRRAKTEVQRNYVHVMHD